MRKKTQFHSPRGNLTRSNTIKSFWASLETQENAYICLKHYLGTENGFVIRPFEVRQVLQPPTESQFSSLKPSFQAI